jgi:hypothetical protein
MTNNQHIPTPFYWYAYIGTIVTLGFTARLIQFGFIAIIILMSLVPLLSTDYTAFEKGLGAGLLAVGFILLLIEVGQTEKPWLYGGTFRAMTIVQNLLLMLFACLTIYRTYNPTHNEPSLVFMWSAFIVSLVVLVWSCIQLYVHVTLIFRKNRDTCIRLWKTTETSSQGTTQ